MKILALEPYYGGSHRSFLDGWIDRSVHQWDLLTLPANKWKWRMRMAAISFADEVNTRIERGETWDVLFCSDMLNLAEFLGLADKRIRDIPSVVYFHENQISYPNRVESDRDYQFVVTNMTTALAADSVWFNSAFHKREFLDELSKFSRKIPKEKPQNVIERIEAKSIVQHPGIDIGDCKIERDAGGPLKILWAARWEHDKNPEDFFAAIKNIADKGVDFRLSVIGEHFREVPEVFTWAKEYFAGKIDRWGFQQSRDEYLAALHQADIAVSSANHEFFGIGIVEAIAAGAYPLLPNRLAYPEVAGTIESQSENEFLYEGSVETLTKGLLELAKRKENKNLWNQKPQRGIVAMKTFAWAKRAKEMDEEIRSLL